MGPKFKNALNLGWTRQNATSPPPLVYCLTLGFTHSGKFQEVPIHAGMEQTVRVTGSLPTKGPVKK